MADIDEELKRRIQNVQKRINNALIETPEDRAVSRFSPYIFNTDLPDAAGKFYEIAEKIGGLEGIEAALDKFDELAESGDRAFLHYELMRFLTHYPQAAKFGLYIPSLEQRSAWKTLPDNKKSIN